MKKDILRDGYDYEDYDINVAVLTEDEKRELGIKEKKSCCSSGGCSKKTSCCGSTKGCCKSSSDLQIKK